MNLSSRRFPWQEIVQLLLLLLAMNAFVIGLGNIVRGAEMSAFLPAAIPAVLLGWFLGRSRMKPWLSLGGLGASGVLLLWGRTAQLGAPLLNLLVTVPGYLFQNFLYMHGGGKLAAFGNLQPSALVIAAQSMAVWVRLLGWMDGLRAGTNVNDPVVRILVWSLLLWLLAVWAGWASERNRVLAGLTPGLAVLAAVTKYTNADLLALWLMAGSMLALLSMNHFDANLKRWRSSRLDYAELITSNTLAAALLIVLGLAALSWAVPKISVHDMLEALRRHETSKNQTTAQSLGLEAAPQVVTAVPRDFTTVRPEGLPNNHLLGSGPELSREVVFRVKTGELPPIPVNNVQNIVPRHYWRSFSFDIYTGSGWVSSQSKSLNYKPEQVLSAIIPNGYRLLHQNFSMQYGEEGSLYWSGTLYRSNLPLMAAWRIPPEQDLPQAVDPFGGADLYGALNFAADFQVDSLVRQVSVEQMRSAGRDIPDFIQQRYTSLPASVPERVYALARDLTSSAATPYDEAMAIESYLRNNYPYSLDVPLPAAGLDVADTFLFELKRGYCDYYATAMAVMARSVGLPARLVTGFATGSYNASTAEYIVTAADAHSWVEIYFPGLGWVEFEPTAGQPEIFHPTQGQSVAQSELNPGPGLDKIVRSLYRLPPAARGVFLGLAVLSGLFVLFFILEGWLLGMLNPLFALRWMYRSIYWQGRRLAGAPVPGQTASEFAEKLQLTLNRPDARLDVLTGIYLQVLFSPQPLQRAQLHQAVRAWRGLRWKLFWTRKKKEP